MKSLVPSNKWHKSKQIVFMIENRTEVSFVVCIGDNESGSCLEFYYLLVSKPLCVLCNPAVYRVSTHVNPAKGQYCMKYAPLIILF